MKKNIFLILIKLLILKSIPISYAQIHSHDLLKITGTVLDAITNQPLPSASIVLFEKNNNKFIKTELSNTDGNFQFRDLHSNTYILRIQYIGYQEYILDSLGLDKDIELQKITLTPIQQSLSEINVTAIKPVIEQTATTTIVNVSESSLATGGTAYDMLQKIPGISTTDDNISTRGKTLSLLLNGRLINIPAEEMIAMLKSLPASSIEKIEINTNPTGKYDGQVQAILDIKTLKPKHDNWEGNISLSAGAGRMFRNSIGANIFYQKKKLALSTGWNYLNNPTLDFFNRNLYFQPTSSTINELRRLTAHGHTNTLKINIEYNPHDKHSLGASIQYGINPQNIFTDVQSTRQRDNSNEPDSIYKTAITIKSSYKNLYGNIYYKISFDSLKKKELIVNADYYNYTRNWIGNNTTQLLQLDNLTEKGNPTLQLNTTPLTIDVRSATLDYTHNTAWGKLETGLKTSWTNIANTSLWEKYNGISWLTDTSLTGQLIYTENIQAIYGTLSGHLKKINFNITLRTEHTYAQGIPSTQQKPFIRDYINLLPSVTIEYNPSKGHQWTFLYRKSLKRPSYQDLSPFLRMRTPHIYAQGNISLVPEITNACSITYGYREHVFVKIFFNYISQYIGEVFQPIAYIPNTLSFRKDNYISNYFIAANITCNQAITSWWNINGSIDAYISQSKNSTITPVSYPNANIEIGLYSTIILPHNWSIESSATLIPPFNTPFISAGLGSSLSTGFKKTFFKTRLEASLLLNAFLPYWYKESFSSYYKALVSLDERSFMFSINYKIGNTKKDIAAKKSKINEERNRAKE